MTQWGLDTLFNPAKRHMDEEKRRLQATRQEVGDNSGGKRIDLESGKVRIGKTGSDGDEPDGDAGDGDGSDSGAGEQDASQPSPAEQPAGKRAAKAARNGKAEPSAAAVRAAQRRGRTAR
jgi:hypothetical protein